MGCASPLPVHWEDLKSRDKNHIRKLPGVVVSEDLCVFTVEFLQAQYSVDADKRIIREIRPNPDRILPEEFQILLIRYLVSPYGGPEENSLISEKDLPGGVTFFQGPHAIPAKPITKVFGSDIEAFMRKGSELGGTAVEFGDKAIKFYPFPEIPVIYILWKADDEFPASLSVLFDKSVSRWFNLDMIFTMLLVLTQRLVEDYGVELIPA